MSQKKQGLTSVEAAALLLSGGRTTDVKEAELIDQGRDLDMDGLTRAALRRQMGFDFKVKVRPSKMLVLTSGPPHLSASAKLNKGDLDPYGNIIEPKAIERLVAACLVLKDKYDAYMEAKNANAVR